MDGVGASWVSWVSNRPLRTSCELRVRDGALVRRRRSGHLVHEMRVRDGALVTQSRSRAKSAGWDAGQVWLVRPSCA